MSPGTVADAGRWAERAAAALSGKGRRRGGAREAVVELLDEQSCALSVSEIRRKLEERRRGVSRASAYRIIDELEAVALLQRVEVGAGPTRYEAIRPGGGHHHHLLCKSCGALEPFTDAALERAIGRLSDRLAMRVSEHEIVIRGACRECLRR